MRRMFKGLLAILLLLLAGEVLRALLHLPVPGSVLGMLLLVASLRLRLIREETVRPTADFLVRHMALFFVPAAVALVAQGETLRAHWLPILAAAVPSTFAVLAVVGWIQQRGAK